MEDLELIERKPCESDKRKVLLHLTDLGKEKREMSKQVVKRFNSEVQKRIEKEELKHFFSTMKKINHILTNEEIFNNEKTH